MLELFQDSSSKEYQKRLKLLGINDIYLNSHSKIDHFNSFLKKHKLDKSEVLFMGDDIPDFKVMKAGRDTLFVLRMPTVK